MCVLPRVTVPAGVAVVAPNGVAMSVTTSPLAAPVSVPEILAEAYAPAWYTTRTSWVTRILELAVMVMAGVVAPLAATAGSRLATKAPPARAASAPARMNLDICPRFCPSLGRAV